MCSIHPDGSDPVSVLYSREVRHYGTDARIPSNWHDSGIYGKCVLSDQQSAYIADASPNRSVQSSFPNSSKGSVSNKDLPPYHHHHHHHHHHHDHYEDKESNIAESRHLAEGLDVPPSIRGRSSDNGDTDASLSEPLQSIVELKQFLMTAPTRFVKGDIIRQLRLSNEERISCVRWNKIFCITGTDIVRALIHRFAAFGRDVVNRKKFEEGVFSDLRNLKINVDATLENPKSELLEFLYKHHCVRTKKKQKVFFWYSVHHDQLFFDALERELKKDAATAKAAQESKNAQAPVPSSMSPAPTVAVREPALSFKYDSSRPLLEQLAQLFDESTDPQGSKSMTVSLQAESLSIPPTFFQTLHPAQKSKSWRERGLKLDHGASEVASPPVTPLQYMGETRFHETPQVSYHFPSLQPSLASPSYLRLWKSQRREDSSDENDAIAQGQVYQYGQLSENYLATPASLCAGNGSAHEHISPLRRSSEHEAYHNEFSQVHASVLGDIKASGVNSQDGSSTHDHEETDFPLELLAREDSELAKPSLKNSMTPSFVNKYLDFAYMNRPALTLGHSFPTDPDKPHASPMSPQWESFLSPSGRLGGGAEHAPPFQPVDPPRYDTEGVSHYPVHLSEDSVSLLGAPFTPSSRRNTPTVMTARWDSGRVTKQQPLTIRSVKHI